LVGSLARELGVFSLAHGFEGFKAAVHWFMTPAQPVPNLLDLVEITFHAINTYVRDLWAGTWSAPDGISQHPDDAIAELNHRFLEHGIGYQFAGKVIRADSTFSHAEVIKPALELLSDNRFQNAETEFLRAHEAYRKGRYSDSLNESLKAFESTLKIICHVNGWAFKPTDAASALIKAVLSNGLVPASLQTQFTSLAALLESGTPTARNKNSGHGMGPTEILVPDYLAAYGLHTAAANISLLVSALTAAERI
jgi:hypothetical protein